MTVDVAPDESLLEELDFSPPCEIRNGGEDCEHPAKWVMYPEKIKRHHTPERVLCCEPHRESIQAEGLICGHCGRDVGVLKFEPL